MQDTIDFQGIDMEVELASLQFAIDFDEINILDGVVTPSRSPSPHIGLNEASFPPQEEGKTESPATEPATKEAGAVKESETVSEETAPNPHTLVAAASSPKEPIRVANGSGANATPAVSTAVLDALNVEAQSRQFPWNGVHSNLSSSTVGLVPSNQGGEMAQVVYSSSHGQYDHLLMIQTPDGVPNESMTNNQLIAENGATNNDLSAIFNQQPSLLQQNPAQSQVGEGFSGSRNVSVAPQRPWNPTWPQYNQIPPANSYAPCHMNWDHSNSRELYSYGEPNYVPMPPNPCGHQHGYRPITSEQVTPSKHAMYANYHPQPAPFVKTYNSMVSGSSMPQSQRCPTLDNLQRNRHHSQMMMGNTAFSVRTSVSRFTAAQLPGTAGTTSSESRLLSTRIPQFSWLSRPLRSSLVEPHTASFPDFASPSGKQAGEELIRILNKTNPARVVASPAIHIGTRESCSPANWREKLQRQLNRASYRLEESKKGEESPVRGRRSRQTELIESSSGFKRQKNNQERGKNTNSSTKREIVNGVYDPQYDKAGLAVDPHLRMFYSSQYNVRDISSDESYPRATD